MSSISLNLQLLIIYNNNSSSSNYDNNNNNTHLYMQARKLHYIAVQWH